MKFAACCLLALMLVCCHAACLGETFMYECDAWLEFGLREEASESARRIRGVEEKDKLLVLEYGDDWCLVDFDGSIGYARTQWLCRFRSLDPYLYEVPGLDRQSGYAVAMADFTVSTGEYEGSMVHTGDVLAVRGQDDGQATLSVARADMTLDDVLLDYTPFPPFEDAVEGDVVYAFTTYYNDHFAARLNEERQRNIELACSRIDGMTLECGERFSFNEVCGPYTKANGYLRAPNISAEGYGVGGGVCQVSTTLYNCLLGVPLQVDEWRVHRDRGVSYAPQHFDSAVGDYSDLAFINTMPYQIVLGAKAQQGVLTVLVRAGEGAMTREEAGYAQTDGDETAWMTVCDLATGTAELLDAPGGSCVRELPCGVRVTLMNEMEGWYRVEAGSHQGYVQMQSLYSPEEPENVTALVNVRVRALPDLDAESLTWVKKTDKLQLLRAGETWSYVRANGQTGFVPTQYISMN
ncbi:MAG: VanW family protein [bacterium]|nr:VanW family protein [bacterium]